MAGVGTADGFRSECAKCCYNPIRAQCWSIDFMSDTLSWGKPYRLLNAIDTRSQNYDRDAQY